jgi:hypothetical protein
MSVVDIADELAKRKRQERVRDTLLVEIVNAISKAWDNDMTREVIISELKSHADWVALDAFAFGERKPKIFFPDDGQGCAGACPGICLATRGTRD